MIVMLVEGKTVDNLVDNLKTNKYQSAQATRQQSESGRFEWERICAYNPSKCKRLLGKMMISLRAPRRCH